MDRFLAAVVQLTSTEDRAANLRSATEIIERAASYGARLVATPENTNFLGPLPEKVQSAEPLDGPTVRHFSQLANRLGIYLLLGSFNEAEHDDPSRCYNTSVLLGPDGSVVESYRKIHLFDVDVSDKVRFRESDAIAAGDDIKVADTEIGHLGFSICYDLRFAELYRKLVDQGSEIIFVPSAFTLTTGIDHWRPLLQARAIENQCYFLAPAQCGCHDPAGKRESFGHAMIVDPWGHVVAMCGDQPGIAVAEIDMYEIRRARAAIPAQKNRRL